MRKHPVQQHGGRSGVGAADGCFQGVDNFGRAPLHDHVKRPGATKKPVPGGHPVADNIRMPGLSGESQDMVEVQ
jgi:hypothetical protein